MASGVPRYASAKSGLNVPFSVRLLVMPQRTLSPGCGDCAVYPQPEPVGGTPAAPSM